MDHYLFASKMKHLTMLYIEDDLEIQKCLGEFLERYTSNLYLAQSAEEGMALYKKTSPNIILLDINLPGKSGIDFAKELRKIDHNTRIIISTAYTDNEFLLTAVELELTRYLVKPVTSMELMEALSKAADEYDDRNILQKVELGEGFSYDIEEMSGEDIEGYSRFILNYIEVPINVAYNINGFQIYAGQDGSSPEISYPQKHPGS